MKAPDKVFFPNDINLLTKLSLAIKQKDDVCYIRKDALLDKLKIQQDKCVYRSTYWDFYQAIITEIKAL